MPIAARETGVTEDGGPTKWQNIRWSTIFKLNSSS